MQFRPFPPLDSLADKGVLLAFLGCLAGFYLLAVTEALGRDLIYTSSGLLVLFGIFTLPRWQSPRQNGMLALSLLAMSISCLAWYYLYKRSGDFGGVYSAYERLGKTLMMSAMLVFIVSNHRLRLPAWLINSITIGAALAINLEAIHIAYATHFERVTLNIPHATTAAYILTVFDILMLHSILVLGSRWRYLLLLIAFFISYCAIIVTGTRAAIIIYPLIFVAMFASDRHTSRKVLISSCVIVLIASAGAMYAFKPVIKARIHSFKDDVRLFEASNSRTSTGARVAMFKSGWYAGLAAPLGQSAEQRAATIHELVRQDPMLAGAEWFLSNHMHNELIESFSERGIIGAALLAWLYYSLLKIALQRRQKNLCLLMITLSMIIYGISDVIFFCREGYVVYLMSIVFVIAFARVTPSEPSTQSQRLAI